MTPRHSLSADEPTLAAGDVLARKYRLLEPLGEGNMATVWVALNVALETRVAVKILRAGLSGDPRLVARFRQEAKATAAIAHKNIVQVYDYGVTNSGAPFIIMELLEGETLAERLKRRGRLPPAEAVRTLLRAMKGVTVAHSKGVVHRDLKPDNIFLAREDNGTERPKVLDFGVSFVQRSRSDQRLTKAGGLLGTPAYLPPEMIEGESRGDVRGDVWAFGVMLHETISGRLPFEGRTVHVLLDAICRLEPAPLSSLVPEVDPALQAIVDRALAKDADERYPGVRELYDDLEAWLQQHEAASRPAAPGLPRLFVDDDGPTLVGPSLESMRALPASDPPPSSDLAPPSSSRPRPGRASSPGLERLSSPGLERVSSPGLVDRASSPGLDRASSPGAERVSRPSSPGPDSAPPHHTPLVASPVGGTRRQALGLGLGLLAAFGLLLVASRTRPDDVRVAAPAPVTTASPAASAPAGPASAPAAASSSGGAPAVDEATLDVVGLPDHALVRLDERRIDRLPVAIERGHTARLRVDAPGYEPWLQEVVIEGSVRLRYGGRPLHAPARPAPSADYREVPY